MDEYDQYDMINAPQFLDFNALVENGGGYDDPETDKYFETHKEEDDFFVPIDKLQPTIQLLSEHPGNVSGAVKGDDSMNDISVEYYNTPNGKQYSITGQESILKSIVNATESTRCATPTEQHSVSQTPSFHTPMGEDDKENQNYTPNRSLILSTAEKTLVASSRRTTSSNAEENGKGFFLRESLIDQLGKLKVSDDEYLDDSSVSEQNELHTADNCQENSCWGSNWQKQPPTVNLTVVVDTLDTPPESPQEVIVYPVNANPEHTNDSDGDNVKNYPRPQSIYIAPSIGCEVIWGQDEKPEGEFDNRDNEYEEEEEEDKLNTLHRSENCLANLVNLTSQDTTVMFHLSPAKNLRRVSSCSDVSKFLVPKTRKSTTVYGFNPRAGITIPKTPDTAKRRAERSRITRTSSNCSSQSSIASSYVSSISTVSKVSVKPENSRKIWSTSGSSRSGITTFSGNSEVGRERKCIPANPYVSFAQAVANFQKNTPTRYRTAPRGGFLPKRSTSVDTLKRRPSPVSPHSPNLMTKQRARQTSQNDTKIDETKSKVQHPQQKQLLKGQMFALPKKIELKTTRPQPFNLTEHSRPKIPKEETAEWKFRARPAPVKILQGPIGVKERQQIKTTAPVELHFASEDRIRERQLKRSAQLKEPSPVRQIVPPKKTIPPRRAPSPMRTAEHRSTTVQPFSFEQRDKELKQKRADKLKQEEQETKSQREFHANPLPSFNSKLPKRKTIQPTHVEPFRFKSDERGAAHQAAFRQKLEEEEKAIREQQKFHAHPAIVTKKKPFEAARSDRPLVEPLDVQLNSDIRAQEREKFDEEIKQKEHESEDRRLKEEATREEKERELELQMRQHLVHKAKPFKNFRVFEVKASNKPLVDPRSPAFNPLPSQRRPNRLNSP